MLCIKHLSEHDQLEYLWKDYSLSFNEEKIQKEFQKLKTKLENYQQLSKEIRHLLLIKNFNDSIENNQKLQTAIETVKKAIEQEDQLESIIGMLVYSK
jgi:PHP family Zn ribbon phosphoesterase